MKILYSTESAKEARDSTLLDSVSLIEVQGFYLVIVSQYIRVWNSHPYVLTYTFMDFESAKEKYLDCGGKLEE